MNYNSLALMVLIFLFVFINFTQAQSPKKKKAAANTADEIIATVCNDKITFGELEKALAELYGTT